MNLQSVPTGKCLRIFGEPVIHAVYIETFNKKKTVKILYGIFTVCFIFWGIAYWWSGNKTVDLLENRTRYEAEAPTFR